MSSAPFLPGIRTRITETQGIPYRDRNEKSPRRWFKLYVGEESATVVIGGVMEEGEMMCSRHGARTECDCRTVVRKYLDTAPVEAN